jgi:uncharacterized protein YciW
VFSTQMGLSDQDIVALSGGHTLVGWIVQQASVFLFWRTLRVVLMHNWLSLVGKMPQG